MADNLRIGEKFDLPIAFATESAALLGKKGAGKTNGASVIAEELVGAGVRTVVLDPIGSWWGVRSNAAGDGPGLPIVIFGGEHADVPISPDQGDAVAQMLVRERASAVVDIGGFRKSDQVKFATAFCERLYHDNREAMMLILEEADVFAPQRPFPESMRLLGAVEDLVRRGRGRGIGTLLLTQRPSVLNKNVLEQVDTLFALQMVGPNDRKAIESWVRRNASPEQFREVESTLATLRKGEAWVWSPSMDILQRVQIRQRRTFDSGRTPKVGEVAREPKVLAEVDLARIREVLRVEIDRAAADDPKALRARISVLELELAEARAARPEPIVERFDVPVLDVVVMESLRQVHRAIEVALERWASSTRSAPLSSDPPHKPKAKKITPRSVEVPASQAVAFRAGARRMLQACAQFTDRGLTRAQIVALAGVKAGGTFSTYLGELQRAGYVEQHGTRYHATDAGLAYLGGDVPSQPHTAREILERWRGKFRAGAQRMLDIIVDAFPRAVSRDELAKRAEIAKGGTFSTYLGELKRAELVDEDARGVFAVIMELVAK